MSTPYTVRPLLGVGAWVLAVLAPTSYAAAAPITGQGTWESTLQARDFDGDTSTIEGYYDTALNITWLANADLAASNSFGLAYGTALGTYPGDPSGVQGIIYADGRMSWPGAMLWIDAMNTANYLGYNGWRLPATIDTGAPGCVNPDFGGTDCGWNVDLTTGEMAHMFYVTLANTPYYDSSGNGPLSGWGLSNTGPFSNLQPMVYWSAAQNALYDHSAWYFRFDDGSQNSGYKSNPFFGWAVHSGDVGAEIVPEPATVWLFASGLLGLIIRARLAPPDWAARSPKRVPRSEKLAS